MLSVESIADLHSFNKGAEKIRLSAQLSQVPNEVLNHKDTLTYLDMSGNQLYQLPDWFIELKKLNILFLSSNQFEAFPDVLSSLNDLSIIGFKHNRISSLKNVKFPKQLRWLILTDNQIDELPEDLGIYSRLEKLMLAGNRLKQIPESIKNCKELRLLRLSANQLERFPTQLLDLKRLAWLAFSGNSFNKTESVDYKRLPEVDWAELTVNRKLGSGASGEVFEVSHSKHANHLALKVFKANITSDGSPMDEMNITIAAGKHQGLISPLAKLKGHPDGLNGLLMPMLDTEDYKIVGLPPSLESCTRDVMIGNQISTEVALHIVRQVVEVLDHLHSAGIMHGDLYAHNLFVNSEGKSVLSDFGAATYVKDVPNYQQILKLEIRALAYLIEDVLTLVEGKDKNTQAYIHLKNLSTELLNVSLTQLPSAHDLVKRLKQRSDL